MKRFDTSAYYSKLEIKKDEFGAIYSKDGRVLYKGCFVESYSIPNGVEIICDRAFQPERKPDYSIIRKIILPDSIKAIGVCAFANNECLEEINIPSSVEFISCNNPFGGCFSLKNIAIYTEKYIIEKDLLYSWDYKILVGAFHTKDTNKKVTINSNTEIIGANSFWHCKNISQIIFPHHLKEIGTAAFKFSSIQNIDLSHTQLTYISEECFRGSALQDICFPNSLESIEANAFRNCHLKRLDLSNTKVRTIGSFAFSHCELTQLVLSSCIEKLEEYAFYNAFSKQVGHNIIIPSSVTYLGDGVFSDNSIKRVDIECENLSNIGEDIFDGTCLETIRYKNTEIISHPNINYYKKKYNVKIVPSDKTTYFATDRIILSLQLKRHICEDNSDYYYQDRIDKMFQVGSIKVDIMQLRLPIYGENYERCLYGACVNNILKLQPKYDAIDTIIAQGKDVYFLTKTNTPLGILYELYYGSKSIYAELSNETIEFGDSISASFNAQKIKVGSELDKTYYGEEIKKKFNYRTNEEEPLSRIGLHVPLQYIAIIKGGKYSIYKSGRRISDYDYDIVNSIDNNIESLNYYALKMTFPKVSMHYLRVGKLKNKAIYYGVINENGDIVIPIRYKELDACRSFILADESLYVLKNNHFALLRENVDLSSPIVVYGGYAFFKSSGHIYCYDTIQVKLIEKDYVIDEGEDVDTVFLLNEMKIKDCFHSQHREISNEEYYKEMDQLYRDAFDNEAELEWNID